LVGAVGLFVLVRDTVDQKTALWSLGLFLFLPLDMFYGRAFMPESWMIASSILGILFFYRWSRSQRVIDLVLSGCFVSLAALLKLPALYLGLPLTYLAWLRDGWRLFARPIHWAYALGVLVPVGAWYAHAHGVLAEGGVTFGIWEYGSDKWGNWDLVSSASFWNGIFFRSLAERWFTWPGFGLFLGGLLLPRRSGTERLFDWWLIAVLIYFVIVAKGNYVHEYYQFPIIPAGVVFVGKVFARYLTPRQSPTLRVGLVTCLVGIAVLSATRYAGYLRRENVSRSAEAIVGSAARAETEPGALVITPTAGNPTLLYLSHRKGWTVDERRLTRDFLARARQEGAKYVVGTGQPPRALMPTAAESSSFRYRTEHGYILELDHEDGNRVRRKDPCNSPAVHERMNASIVQIVARQKQAAMPIATRPSGAWQSFLPVPVANSAAKRTKNGMRGNRNRLPPKKTRHEVSIATSIA